MIKQSYYILQQKSQIFLFHAPLHDREAISNLHTAVYYVINTFMKTQIFI